MTFESNRCSTILPSGDECGKPIVQIDRIYHPTHTEVKCLCAEHAYGWPPLLTQCERGTKRRPTTANEIQAEIESHERQIVQHCSKILELYASLSTMRMNADHPPCSWSPSVGGVGEPTGNE